MISRKAFVPIALVLTATALLTAMVSHLALDSEFHDAQWIVDPHPPLPYPMIWLRAIYPGVWILPVATGLAAAALLRRPSISGTAVAWFISSATFTLFCWSLLIAVAYFTLYAQSGHYIRPLGN